MVLLLSLLSESTPYLEFVIIFTTCVSIFHLYLDTRQLKALKLPAPPIEVESLYTDINDFKKKQAYQLDRLRFGMIQSIYDTTTSIAFLILGFYPTTWHLSGLILAKHFTSLSPIGEIPQTIMWVLLLSAFGTVMGLPWSVYRTFSLEQRHGFNKTTPRTFVTDIIKSVVLTVLFTPPIIAAIVWILLHTGPRVALYLWGFVFTLSIVMMTVYPTLIAPLFNTYETMKEGPLRQKIEALAAVLGFPLKKLFVVDGSKRSGHSNAYMYGFFSNKRIVLYDTLLTQCTDDQVTAVLAHELGHWKLRHTPVLFIASQCVLASQLALFAMTRGAPGLYTSFGFPVDERPALAALLLFQMIIGPVDEVLGLLQNVVSRKFEFQADNFGVSLGWGKDLKTALCVLDKENKGPPNVDELYSAYHYSHPPLPERLRAIDAAMKKTS